MIEKIQIEVRVEYKIDQFSLRAGYRFEESPYEDDSFYEVEFYNNKSFENYENIQFER